MPTIEIHVPAVPVAQPRHRVGVIAGKARAFGAKKSHPIHDFKATVRMAAREAYQGPPLEGPLRCDVVAVFPRTSAQRWKTRPMPRLRHAKKPDADNITKAIMDSLTGILWIDDCQVCDGRIEKWIASGEEQPHVEIVITEL